jgi:type I restriction enzyme, S subunit
VSASTLPDGWTRATLRDLCAPARSVEPARETPDKEFAYVDISAIDRVKRTIVEPKLLLGSEAPSRARQLIASGDVLYSTVRPNLRTFAAVPPRLGDAVASTGFCVLRASDAVRPGYLFWLLSDPALQDRITAKARGVSYPAVREDDILEELVSVPPLVEQDLILELLDDLGAGYQLASVALEEARLLLPSLRVRAVADLQGGPWPLRRIDEVGEVFVGATPSRRQPELWGGDVPWVSSSEVAFCRITGTKEHISEVGVGNRDRRLHPPGTVLLAMYGEGKTRGQAAMLEITAATNQAVAAVRLDPTKMRPAFLYFCLMRQYDDVRRLGRGGQQLNLNKALVQSIEVPSPPLVVQDELVGLIQSQLHACAQQKQTLTNAQTLGRAVWTALLRDALAGDLTVRQEGAQSTREDIQRIRAARPPALKRRATRASARAEQQDSSSIEVEA